MTSDAEQLQGIREAYDEQYGFRDPDTFVFKARKGLDAEIVAQISEIKGEPQWMREQRLKALEIYQSKPVPTWGADLSGLREDDIYFFVKPAEKEGRSWDEVPDGGQRCKG